MKFKLLKWYPGIPKETVSAKSIDINDGFYELLDKSGYVISKEPLNINNFINEYWEGVKEVNYKVLELKSKSGDFVAIPSIKENHFHFPCHAKTMEGSSLEAFLRESWTISKIQRLSDSEIFTIGDKVQYGNNSIVIEKIELSDIANGGVFLNNSKGSLVELNFAKKHKPFFVTHDGVEVEERTICYWAIVHYKLKKITTITCNIVFNHFEMIKTSKEKMNVDYVVFYSEKARDKFIEENTPKPILVTEDGVEIFNGDEYVHKVSVSDFCKYSKIKAKNLQSAPFSTRKIFSTAELANEFILMNKPCLSVNDVINYTLSTPLNVHAPAVRRFKELAKSKLNM